MNNFVNSLLFHIGLTRRYILTQCEKLYFSKIVKIKVFCVFKHYNILS